MEEWKEYKLGDITSKIGSGATPKGGKESYLGGDIALIRSQNILDFAFSNSGLAYINKDQASKLNNVEVKENDILLNITGDSVARACIVPQKILPARVNQHVAIIRGNDIVDNKYLLYYLQHIKPYLLSLSQGGATRNALTKKMLEDLDIKVPSKNVQNIIVSVLSSLDDKIELNRRINENLEQQAQALFKSWFVDFEPFKDGKFVDSELGKIPEGWRINLVKNIAIFTQGTQVPISMQYNTQKENMIRFIRIVDYTSNNTEFPRFIYKTSKQTECDESDVIMVRYGNIGTIGRRLTGVIANNLFKISPSNILTKNFLYYFFKQKEIQELIVASAAGSAMPAIKHSTIGNINIIVPSKGIVTMFDLICNSYEAQILKNNQENSYLKEVRDTLLPKLMSGDLKLGEIETKLYE